MLPRALRVIEEYRDILCYEFDTPEEPAVCNQHDIRFNGKDDDGHETFTLENKKQGFQFCKTARKPYDTPVCIILALTAVSCPGFDLSSNGDQDDWEPAITRAKEMFPELAFHLQEVLETL